MQRGARLAAKKVTCNVTLVGSDHFRVLPSLARLMAQGAELPVIFDDGCVVVNDVEYWFGSIGFWRCRLDRFSRIPPNTDVSKVGTLIAFLEQQDGLRGRGRICAYSARKRKIVTTNV